MLMLVAVGCAGADKNPTAVTKIVHDEKICRGMEKFQAKHVDAFFAKAKPVTSHEIHGMDVLPCIVEGRTVIEGQTVTFKIQPLGSADVTDASGKTTLYGCDDCSELFPPH